MLERLFAKLMPAPLISGRLPMHLVPILVVSYACLLPREFTIMIEGAALFPYRFALILMLPFCIARLSSSPVRPSLVDACVGFAAVWFVVSLMVTTSYEAGMVSGVSYAIDYAGAYLLGRASIRTAEDLRLMLRYLLPGMALLVLVLAVESVSHRMLLRPLLADLLNTPDPYIYYRIRFGLLRAMGPFPHPILGGVFLAGLIPLAWYLSHTARTRIVGCLLGLGAIFTVSSTAVLGMVIAIGLITMDVVQRITRFPIFALGAIMLALMAIAVSVVSETGLISFIIRNFTFDTGSGYYRMIIWSYGGAEAMANPVFGIGMRDWARPEGMVSDSVDAYWLVETMVHGFPMLAALAMTTLGVLIAVFQTQKFRHPADRDAGKAMMIFITVVIFSGFTVHLWESINSWAALMLGCGMSLATQARVAPAPVWRTANPEKRAMAEQPLVAE